MIIKIINNLNVLKNKNVGDNSQLAIDIAQLVNVSMAKSNNNIYSKEDMDNLSRNKTKEAIQDLINRSFVVYLTTNEEDLIGCGMITRQDDRYFAKTLHVNPNYRGMGYAQLICDLREEFLESLDEHELYIESLKYQKTIEFHQKRGFSEIKPYKELKYTILMKKTIK